MERSKHDCRKTAAKNNSCEFCASNCGKLLDSHSSAIKNQPGIHQQSVIFGVLTVGMVKGIYVAL